MAGCTFDLHRPYQKTAKFTLILQALLASHSSICAFSAGVLRSFCAQAFLALLLFAAVCFGQQPTSAASASPVCQSAAGASTRTFRVPFHTVNGMILLDATVNDNTAKLILDTGSNVTIVSPQMFSLAQLANDSLGQMPSLFVPTCLPASARFITETASENQLSGSFSSACICFAYPTKPTPGAPLGETCSESFEPYASTTKATMSNWRNR